MKSLAWGVFALCLPTGVRVMAQLAVDYLR